MAERAPRRRSEPADQEVQDTSVLDTDLIDILGAGSLLGKPAKGHDPRDYRSYRLSGSTREEHLED